MSMTLVYAVCLDVVIQNNFISKYISSYDRFSKPFCHLFRLILRLFWVKTQYNNAWQVRAVRCVWRNSCTRAKCFSRLIIDISLPKLSFDRYNFLVYWDIYSWLMISIFEANYYYCLLKKKQTSVYRKLDPKWTTLAWTHGTQFYSGPHLNLIILWRTVVQAEKRTLQSSACPRWLTGKIFVISPLGLLPLVPDSSLPAVEYNRNNSLG